jgi:hypothetical protein
MVEYDKDDPVQKMISKYEIRALGIENSEVVYPGSHVDAHIAIGNGEEKVLFAARIFATEGIDADGNDIHILVGYRRSSQSWDTGGAYLKPNLEQVEPPYVV